MVPGVPEIPEMWARSLGTHARSVLKWDVALVNKTLSTIFDGVTLRNLDLDPKLDLSSPPGQTLELLALTIALGAHDESIKSEKASALLSEATLRLIFENFPHRFSNRLDRPPTLSDIAEAAGSARDRCNSVFNDFAVPRRWYTCGTSVSRPLTPNCRWRKTSCRSAKWR